MNLKTMERVLLISILGIFSGCLKEQSVSPTQQTDAITDAEYAVLSAVVHDALKVPSDSIIVVWDSTEPGTYANNLDTALTALLLHLSQEIPVLEPTTMSDYKAKNLSHSYVQSPSKIHPGCIRASSTSRRFPGLDVSRVGFSVDGQQALVYAGFSNGPLAGAGFCYVLAHQNGTWFIIGSSVVWIS